MLGQQTSSTHTTSGNRTPSRQNHRLSKYTESQYNHSPGWSTTRDCTSRPTHRAAQPYHTAKYILGSHLRLDLRRSWTSLCSTSTRRAHIHPQAIGRQAGKTVGSASTRRASMTIVPAETQLGTAHLGPPQGSTAVPHSEVYTGIASRVGFTSIVDIPTLGQHTSSTHTTSGNRTPSR